MSTVDMFVLVEMHGHLSGLLLGAVVGAAAAGLGREGAEAEGLAGDIAIDGVAAARVHALARVRRRAAPAPFAHLEWRVRRRLRRRHRRPAVHHLLLHHRNVVLLGGLLACRSCSLVIIYRTESPRT
jgi:hypothetical protein